MKHTQGRKIWKKLRKRKISKNISSFFNTLLRISTRLRKIIWNNQMTRNKSNRLVKRMKVSIIFCWTKITYPSLSEMKHITIKILLKNIWRIRGKKMRKESRQKICIAFSNNSSPTNVLASSKIIRTSCYYLKNKLRFILETRW